MQTSQIMVASAIVIIPEDFYQLRVILPYKNDMQFMVTTSTTTILVMRGRVTVALSEQMPQIERWYSRVKVTFWNRNLYIQKTDMTRKYRKHTTWHCPDISKILWVLFALTKLSCVFHQPLNISFSTEISQFLYMCISHSGIILPIRGKGEKYRKRGALNGHSRNASCHSDSIGCPKD